MPPVATLRPEVLMTHLTTIASALYPLTNSTICRAPSYPVGRHGSSQLPLGASHQVNQGLDQDELRKIIDKAVSLPNLWHRERRLSQAEDRLVLASEGAPLLLKIALQAAADRIGLELQGTRGFSVNRTAKTLEALKALSASERHLCANAVHSGERALLNTQFI